MPRPRLLAQCKRQFEVGAEIYVMEVQLRDMSRHAAYFAAIGDIFGNLNEEDTQRFKSEEHLRAWALVHTGFCTETDYPCDSKEEAMLTAKIIRSRSAYSIIKVGGDVVKVFDPESQAIYGPHAMPAERFYASAKAVLDLISPMARTTPSEALSNAGTSA